MMNNKLIVYLSRFPTIMCSLKFPFTFPSMSTNRYVFTLSQNSASSDRLMGIHDEKRSWSFVELECVARFFSEQHEWAMIRNKNTGGVALKPEDS